MDKTNNQNIYNDIYLNCIRKCFIIHKQKNYILYKKNSNKALSKKNLIKSESEYMEDNMNTCNDNCKKNILQIFDNSNDFWLKKFSSER